MAKLLIFVNTIDDTNRLGTVSDIAFMKTATKAKPKQVSDKNTLLQRMLKAAEGDSDMTEMIRKQIHRAKLGDLDAAKFILERLPQILLKKEEL